MSIYVGTVGLYINVDVDVNIASPGQLRLRTTKPNGAVVLWNVHVDVEGAGLAHYNTASGDLSEAGTYAIQPQWEPDGAGAGKIFYGTPKQLVVKGLGE